MVTGGEARFGGRQTLGFNFTWFLYLFSRYFLGTGCIRCLALETQQCEKTWSVPCRAYLLLPNTPTLNLAA